MTKVKSGIYGDGSYGLRAKPGNQTLRVWFCGRPREKETDLPCVHRTKKEAQECAKRNN